MTGTMDRFLRSISLRLDVAHPDRFAHFRPTAKSAEVLQAIAGETTHPASLIVAAYGSGKSLTAGTGALLVSNEPEAEETLSTLSSRLERVAPELANFADSRVKNGTRGCVIVLEGHQSDVATAIQEEAKERLGTFRRANGADADVISILNAIARKAKREGRDRLTIIWDEFGRHLEALASSGRAEELGIVQQIAEWASRQTEPQVTFNLLLHQSFFHYAGNLSQSARNSWRKIEGRFEAVRFIEDSREMYELIASVVGSNRNVTSCPEESWFKQLASDAREVGLFTQFKDDAELAKTLRLAYPLSPAVLYTLPRLASRLAQNERTVFSFIHEDALDRVVTLKNLYNYFADAMEADTGIGGTHRRWLETESALSKAETEDEEEALTAAALLGLGVSGERTRLKRDTLIFALAAHGCQDHDAASAVVDRLIERKLLLYRQRNDDVSVWHGTDQDIRGRLEEEKLRLEGAVDPVRSLATEHPAPIWRPVAHNVRNRIRRYYTGTYVAASELLKRGRGHPQLQLETGEDGRVIYAVPESVEEVNRLRKLAMQEMPDEPGLVLVSPEAPVPIKEVVLEIAALRALQQDSELTASDPFVAPELQHMLNAARENLADLVSRMVSPGWNGGIWYACGGELLVRSEGELRQKLSELADRRFLKTPCINNELIVRKQLTKPMVNARKKLLLGVLERAGVPHLGFDNKATTPDVTLYRTVLQHTGLYHQRGNVWTWAQPEEVSGPGLAEVWGLLRCAFQDPGRKNVVELIKDLRSPPYGVRNGVIPILFGAALQAFGQAVVLRRDGEYLSDILASEVEALCAEPERFSIEVLELDENRAAYLRDIVEQFGGTPQLHGDLIRQCYDAIESWKVQLPDSALKTTKVSADARKFQKAIRTATDPANLLLERFPELVGHKSAGRQTASDIAPLRQEIEGIIEGFTASAVSIIRDNLTITLDTPGDALERAKAWADCFPDDAVPRQALDQTARAVLVRAKEATGGRYTEASFARALSAILLQRGLDTWDDRTSNVFADRLREAVERVENAAMKAETPSRAMVPLLEGRLNRLYRMLQEVLGPEEAEAAVRRAAGRNTTDQANSTSKSNMIGG